MITCEWFALCDRPTFKGAAHPVLGVVPICDRCASKLDIDPGYILTQPSPTSVRG